MKFLISCLEKDCLRRDNHFAFSFFKKYNTRMKTIRELKIKDWSCYFLKEMVNILDINPDFSMINDFKDCKDGSTIFNIAYFEEDSVPHIVFNNIELIFRKSGVFSYLIFCENDKSKNMLNNYVEIVVKIKEEILSWTDELEDEICILGKDFMRFKFKTEDKLVYNKKINILVCVISLSSVIKKGDWYYPQFKLQKYFYKN